MADETRVLTAIDLFSGAGGMSRGLASAGFVVLAAIEKDADAAATYEANHGGVRVYRQDIATLPAARVMRDLGLKPKELAVLAGCPPCQGFTRLTEKQARRDPRNALVREYLRFVRVMLPRTCIFENVPGLAGRGKSLFKELRAGLTRLGYLVSFDVLQMANFGVPQFRRRLVLLASRVGPVTIPSATHTRPETAGREGLRPWRTVRDVIGHLPAPPLRSAILAGKDAPRYEWHYTRDVSDTVRKRLEHALKFGGRRRLPKSLRLACHNRECDGYNDVYGCMSWSEPAPTITSGCTNASKGRFGHPASPRPITAREAAALQGFPLSYRFRGAGVESVAAQIGNAVPAGFSKILAKRVRQVLLAL